MALNYCDGMSSNRSGGSVGLASDAADQAPFRSFDKSRTALVRRARAMNRILATTYPDAHIELDFSNPLELLVATILSAQSTDKRVNLVTPVLFIRYPDAAAYAAADRADLEELIKPTGFFRAKTDTLIKLGAALTERFDGEVPQANEGSCHAPRRRPENRQCGARQRLRYSGYHCRYPFRTAGRDGSAGPPKPTRTRSNWRSPHCSRPRTGRSSATTSFGMAGAAVTPGTRPAAPARSLACAPRTGKERPIRPRRPSWCGSRGDDNDGSAPPDHIDRRARKVRTGRKFDIETGLLRSKSPQWSTREIRRGPTSPHRSEIFGRRGWLAAVVIVLL